MARHPNVLLICTDQQRASSLGCTGNPHARTPHLDALAAAGTVHRRFMVANTVCMPSRASLLTGCYPSTHGVWQNGVPLARADDSTSGRLRDIAVPHLPTLPDAVAAAGWHTAAVGKLHLTPTRSRGELGYREAYDNWDNGHNAGWTGPYYGFQEVALTSGHGDEGACSGRGHYGAWLADTRPDLMEACRRARTEAPRIAPGVDDAYGSPMTVEHHPSTWIGEQCARIISERSASEEPWFLWAGFPDPHHPFVPPAELWAEFVDAPCLDPVDQAQALLACTPTLARHDNRLQGVAIEAQRNLVRATDAMNHLIDRAVGRMIAAIEAAGQWENTIIVFTSDHGELLGDHGLLRKNGHGCRALLQVPCLIRAPGQGLPAELSTAADNTSLAPSLARWCGVDLPQPVDGSVITDSTQALAQCANVPQPDERNLSWFDERFRVTWYPEFDRCIAFDHAADPHETQDVAADHPQLVAQARAAMADALARSWRPYQARVSPW